MEMLYSQPGLNYIAEPLNLWYYRPEKYWKMLPEYDQAQFIAFTCKTDEDKMNFLYTGLLDKKLKLHSQWCWWDRDYSFIEDRLIIKTLNANTLIDWFAAQFDAHIIYLVRHPVPYAMSVLHTGWGPVVGAFLRNTSFCNNYVRNAMQECENIANNGTHIEKYLLEWCFMNVMPLTAKYKLWLTLSYEELIARPDKICELLSQHCDLPFPKLMESTLSRPSESTQGGSIADIKQGGSIRQLQKGAALVNDPELQEAYERIHNCFPVPGYNPYTIFPDESLCHFGTIKDG